MHTDLPPLSSVPATFLFPVLTEKGGNQRLASGVALVVRIRKAPAEL
jgi:hypothetical protein